LWDQQKLELIGGELIDKTPKNRPHQISLMAILLWLQQSFGSDCGEPETPIDVAPEDNPANEPQPDLIVLARSFRQFPVAPTPPGPSPDSGDIRLHGKLRPRHQSRPIRTRRNRRVWVVDIPARRIVVHWDPKQGQYQSVTAFSSEESVSPLSAPTHQFPVEEAFG
jgi:hypothetical protein